jgi:hypothetical protein
MLLCLYFCISINIKYMFYNKCNFFYFLITFFVKIRKPVLTGFLEILEFENRFFQKAVFV